MTYEYDTSSNLSRASTPASYQTTIEDVYNEEESSNDSIIRKRKKKQKAIEDVKSLSQQLREASIESKATVSKDKAYIDFFVNQDQYWNSNTQSKISKVNPIYDLSPQTENKLRPLPKSNKKKVIRKSKNDLIKKSADEFIDKKERRKSKNAESAKKYREKKKKEEEELDKELNRISSRYSDLQNKLSEILCHKRSLITVINGTKDKKTLPEFCKSVIYHI